MKKAFTAGLAILLPIVLTVMILLFFVNLLTAPFLAFAAAFIKQISLIHSPALILLISKLLILLFLFAFVLLMGFIGNLFLVKYLFLFGDYILHQLPLINKIYKACKDMTQTLFADSSTSFSHVVLVPYPSPKTRTVGFVTRKALRIEDGLAPSKELIPVFVPGTPNPSVGFMLLFEKEKLIFTQMKVDEALKFIVSCGIVMNDFNLAPPFSPHEPTIHS